MPKLRNLEVCDYMNHGAAWLRRCTNLEALKLFGCTMFVGTRVVQMTRLTSICIGITSRVGNRGVNADVSWLKHATNLRTLQALAINIGTAEGALPLIGNLTGLTGLTLYGNAEGDHSIAPLVRLTRLRCLDVSWEMSESNLGMACSLGSGSLVSLRVMVDQESSADCGRFLSRQTALTRLVVSGWQLWDTRHIGALNVEFLQSLELSHLNQLDSEGISALWKAPNLTALVIRADDAQIYEGLSLALPSLTQLLALTLLLRGGGITEPHIGLTRALAQLTLLRSLELELWCARSDTKFLDYQMALSPLTALTQLGIARGGLDNKDVWVLWGLTGLRVLRLTGCPVTDDMVPELGFLTNLRTLEMRDCGVRSLESVTEVLDPLREARGLPPMFTVVRPCEALVGGSLWLNL